MNTAAFDAFVGEHYEPVRRALSVALGDADRAEDLAQEAFARALARWPQVSAMERPVAWVYVVAINQARRDLRRDGRRLYREPVVELVDIGGSVATSVSLTTAVAALPTRQRTAVVLRYLCDLSTAEVAEAMRCAEGTVKSTLHAAVSKLRIEFQEDHE